VICNVLNFSELRWFWEHFEATVYCCTFWYLCWECCSYVCAVNDQASWFII